MSSTQTLEVLNHAKVKTQRSTSPEIARAGEAKSTPNARTLVFSSVKFRNTTISDSEGKILYWIESGTEKWFPPEPTLIYRAKARSGEGEQVGTSESEEGNDERELVATFVVPKRGPDTVTHGGETKEVKDMFPRGKGIMDN